MKAPQRNADNNSLSGPDRLLYYQFLSGANTISADSEDARWCFATLSPEALRLHGGRLGPFAVNRNPAGVDRA